MATTVILRRWFADGKVNTGDEENATVPCHFPGYTRHTNKAGAFP